MPQKYGHRANETVAAQKGRPCVICETEQPVYSWTDLFGQATCTRCGIPFQLVARKEEDDPDFLPRIEIVPEYVPIMQRYWKETGRGMGQGSYMGFRDYPGELENRQAFGEWDDKRLAVEGAAEVDVAEMISGIEGAGEIIRQAIAGEEEGDGD